MIQLFQKSVGIFLLSFLSLYSLGYADPQQVINSLEQRLGQNRAHLSSSTTGSIEFQGPSRALPENLFNRAAQVARPWQLVESTNDNSRRDLLNDWRRDFWSESNSDAETQRNVEALLNLFIIGVIIPSAVQVQVSVTDLEIPLMINDLLSGHDWFASQRNLFSRFYRFYIHRSRLGASVEAGMSLITRMGDSTDLPSQEDLTHLLKRDLGGLKNAGELDSVLVLRQLLSLRVAQILRGESGPEAAVLVMRSLQQVDGWYRYPVLAQTILDPHQGSLSTNLEFQKERLRLVFKAQKQGHLVSSAREDQVAQQTFLRGVLNPFLEAVTGPLNPFHEGWNPNRWLESLESDDTSSSDEDWTHAREWFESHLKMREIFKDLPTDGYTELKRSFDLACLASLGPLLRVESRLRGAGRLPSYDGFVVQVVREAITADPLWWHDRGARQATLAVLRQADGAADHNSQIEKAVEQMEQNLSVRPPSRESIQESSDRPDSENFKKSLHWLQATLDLFDVRIATAERNSRFERFQIETEESLTGTMVNILSEFSRTTPGRAALREIRFSDELFIKIAQRYIERHSHWFDSPHHRPRVLSMIAFSGQWGRWGDFDPWSFLMDRRGYSEAEINDVRRFIIDTLNNPRLLTLTSERASDSDVETLPTSTRLLMNPMIAEGVARTIRRFGLLDAPPEQFHQPHTILDMLVQAVAHIRPASFTSQFFHWPHARLSADRSSLILAGEFEEGASRELRRPLSLVALTNFIEKLSESHVRLDRSMIEDLDVTKSAVERIDISGLDRRERGGFKEIMNRFYSEIRRLACDPSLESRR